MKKSRTNHIIIVIVLFMAFTSYAQPANSYIKDYAPPSPTAAIMQKNVNIPVNTFNGTAGISIPIHTITEGPLTTDISLSYNTSGIKVSEMASWVGLGWHLNAGGMVNRTVVGYEDDKVNGFMTGACEQNYDAELYYQILNFSQDCQPDIFYFSFGGYSGKMVYAPHMDVDGGWYVYPKSDLVIKEIKTSNMITAFQFTTPDGTVYTFGDGEVEKSEYSTSSQVGTGNTPYITTWFLKSIISHDGLHGISFTYESEHLRYPTLGSNYEYSTYNAGQNCIYQGGNTTSVQPMYNFVDSKRLSTITTSTSLVSVAFVAESNERQDVTAGINPAKPKALDKIDITTGSFCKTYDLGYHYTTASGGTAPEYKRLVLDAIQERSCNSSATIPPHTFTYTDIESLPHRLSKQVDHWGYANGKASNESLPTLIPNNATIQYGNVTLYYNGNNTNGCNRNTDPTHAKKGSLSAVTYPNGGTTSLTMESNTEYGLRRSGVYDTPVHNKYSNCNSNPNFNYLGPCKAFTAAELTKAQLKLDMDLSGNGNGCPAMPPRFNVKVTAIEDVSSGTPLTSFFNFTINAPSASETTDWLDMASIFQPALSPGVPYYFQMSIEPGPFYGEGDVHLYVRYLPEENNAVAGLRVAKIESKENPTATPITTDYSYNDALGHSTGVVLIEPRYGYYYLMSFPFVVVMKKYTSFPLVSTSDLNGHQVGYREVKVSRPDTGYDTYRYKATKQVSTGFPIIPLPTIYDNGALTSGTVRNDLSAILKQDSTLYQVPNLNGLVAAQSKQYFVEKAVCDGTEYYLYKDDILEVPSYLRPTSMTSSLDEVVTETSYGYDPFARFNEKISTSIINSDGVTYATEHLYAYNYPAGAIKDSLIKKNMIYPAWQTVSRVGGTIVDGQQTSYGFYTIAGLSSPSSTHRLYPNLIKRYEHTWDASGTPSNIGWQTHTTMMEYHDLYYKPTKIQTSTLTNPVLLSYYTNGTLQSIQYTDHTQTHTYHTGTALLASKTAMDGQVTSYSYDALWRPIGMAERGGNHTTNYEYHYHDMSDMHNWVKTIHGYALVAGSALQKIETKQYFDGLGRESLTLQVDHSPALKDVATAYRYDVLGRPSDTTIPVESSSSGGTYFIVSPTTPKTNVQYEASSLDRVHTTTPPSWYDSQVIYSSNASTLAAPWGYTYAAHSLTSSIITDADGKKAIAYKDKVGRVVLLQNCDSHLSTCADTWTRYDDKGRVSRVYPPGSTASTNKLWYSYTYDTDDNIVIKRIPGSNIEEYVYDTKNLLVGRRNPVLLSSGKWLVYHYDAYNRPIKTGLQNLTSILPATPNPIIHTLLEENHYDGYNGTSTNTAAIYKGKLKKKRIKALDDLAANTTWTETEYFYDSYGRVSSTTGSNHRGSTETTAMTYDMADNVLSECHTITGTDGVSHVMTHTYDHQGRLIDDKVNIDASGERTLATLSYNHRDEVIERNIGRFATTGTHQYLQSLDYTYNAQGWLTKINELYSGILPSGPDPCTGSGTSTKESSESGVVTVTDDEDLFALKLDYDISVLGQPINKNGNITGQTWNHKGQYPQSYGYTYDYLNRVIDAKHDDSDNYSMTPERYTEKLAYDVRGNITNLRRLGVTNRTDINTGCYKVATIDSLVYTYAANSNVLSKVEDLAACPDIITLPADIDRDVHYAANQKIIIDHTTVDCHADLHLTVADLPQYKKIEIRDSFKIPTSCATAPTVRADVGPCPQDHYTPGFNQQSTSTYVHDNSGNMTYDPHKKLTFYYNHLNLPYKIVGAESDELQLLYASDGTLLQRKYVQNNVVKNKIDYIFGKEYHNDTLEYIHHKDGRMIKHNNTWQYEYSIKDHLGNVRATFCDLNGNGIISNNERRSRLDYYTFGLEHYNPYTSTEYSASKNLHRYNGKEKVEEMGWNNLLYGARNYDATIGRFTTVDPSAQLYSAISAFSYTINNPIRYIDPDGREISNVNGGVHFTGDDAKLVFKSLKEKVNSSGGIQAVHFVFEKLTPNIYRHTLDAFKKGKPFILHYDKNKAEKSNRRDIALKNFPSRGKDGLQRDEYPFASTREGGNGALIAYVPAKENKIQGGHLGSLYKVLEDGEAFLVIPVPEKNDNQPEPSFDFIDNMRKITGLTGAALSLYVIISEGSRVIPLRNIVPIL